MNPGIGSILSRLFSIMSTSQKLWLVILFFVVLVASLLQMMTVGAIPMVVSALQTPEVVAEHRFYQLAVSYLGFAQTPVVDVAIISLVVVFVSANLSRILVLYLRARIVRDFTNDLSKRLFAFYLAAPFSFHLQTNSALAIRNLTDEISTTVSNFSSIVTMTMSFLTAVFILALLFVQDAMLTGFVLAVGAVSGFMVFNMTRKVSSSMGRIVHIEQAEMFKIINHTFGGMRDIKVLDRLGFFAHQFRGSVGKYCDAKLKQTVVSGVVQPLIQSAGLLALMMAIFFAYQSDGGMAHLLPTIALFGAALHRLMPTLSELVATSSKLYYNIAGTKAVVDDIIRFESELGEVVLLTGDDGSPAVAFEDRIELRDVRFTYPLASRPSLVDVSLQCRHGEMIGIIGETGSGKSTIIDVILGLIKPDSGQVLVDGEDVTNWQNRWAGRVGMVSQSVFLMDETVRGNVTMGLSEERIDDEKVWRALELAQVDDVVRKLPGGLDEVVGERGVRLSGGERQRIALARALYANPTMLIMDEGTSALDNQTEKKLMDAIKSLRSNYTIIMIAHRLTSVRDCDRLYLVEDGQVVADGTYNELVASSDQFHTLAALGERHA